MSEAPPTVVERPRIPSSIWTLLLATFFIAVGFALIVPVLPKYAQSFGVGATLVSVVVSAFAFMRLAGAPAAGPLVDKFGERIIYISGLLLVAASTAATAFAQNYTQLLIFRGLGGLGSVLFTISASSLIVRLAPPLIRGRVSALWAGTFLFGNIVGPVIGGFLGQFGMRVPFIVYSIALVIAASIVGFFLRVPSENTAQAGDENAAARPVLELRDALAHRSFVPILAVGLANGWANFGVRSAILPLYIAAAISDETWVIGVVLAVQASGTLVSLQWAGRKVDEIGRKPFITWGMGLSVITMAAIPFIHELWTFLVLSFFGGLAAGMMGPASQAVVADIITSERKGGKVLSAFQMVQDIGVIVGPIATGFVVDQRGYGWAFALTAAVIAFGTIAWLRGEETLPTLAPAHAS